MSFNGFIDHVVDTAHGVGNINMDRAANAASGQRPGKTAKSWISAKHGGRSEAYNPTGWNGNENHRWKKVSKPANPFDKAAGLAGDPKFSPNQISPESVMAQFNKNWEGRTQLHHDNSPSFLDGLGEQMQYVATGAGAHGNLMTSDYTDAQHEKKTDGFDALMGLLNGLTVTPFAGFGKAGRFGRGANESLVPVHSSKMKPSPERSKAKMMEMLDGADPGPRQAPHRMDWEDIFGGGNKSWPPANDAPPTQMKPTGRTASDGKTPTFMIKENDAPEVIEGNEAFRPSGPGRLGVGRVDPGEPPERGGLLGEMTRQMEAFQTLVREGLDEDLARNVVSHKMTRSEALQEQAFRGMPDDEIPFGGPDGSGGYRY